MSGKAEAIGMATDIARINAPTARNLIVFAVSLLPWPTVVAGAFAFAARQPFDLRLWAALTVAWAAVELVLRNPHEVVLERDGEEPDDCCAIVVRSWLAILSRRPGVRILLGPESRLVRNLGIVRAPGEQVVELRIYRWQFAALVHAFERAGFEVHDESEPSSAPWLRRLYVLAFVGAALLAAALLAAAFLRR